MSKSQSAMEYLMTYGWAILIIAVVLGALYSLGLFNGVSLGPKAAPGSCQVYRPNGPFSTTYISLDGVCNTEPPQYVAQFNSIGLATSYVVTGGAGLPLANSQRSVFAWVYLRNYPSAGTGGDIYDYGTYNTYQRAGFIINPSGALGFSGFADDWGGATLTVPLDTWTFTGYTYTANATNGIILYVNGKSASFNLPHALATVLPSPNPAVIGYSPSGGYNYPFLGLMSDVQVYNSTLDATSVNALYVEGVGGAPINLQTLVAWWPLNGNANDYSGNLNNGQPTAVTYTNQWQNGYAPP